MKELLFGIFLFVFLMPSVASAHIYLLEPPHRYEQFIQKEAPCGLTGGERGDEVTTFAPGETITMVWDEFIPHPGHFRVSFSVDGDEDFVDPVCLADCDSRDMEIELYSDESVLIDGIPRQDGGGIYEVEVELPDITCERCTLQLMQIMTDKPPYTLPGNDLYYNCANIVLAESGSDDQGADVGVADVGVADSGMSDGGTGEESGGCSQAGGTPTMPLALVFLLGLAALRRRN